MVVAYDKAKPLLKVPVLYYGIVGEQLRKQITQTHANLVVINFTTQIVYKY